MKLPPPLQPLWRQRVCIAAAAIAVFATSVTGPFIRWDDNIYVAESERIHRPGIEGLEQLWSSKDAWTGRFLEFFPLRDTVYWTLWHGFGDDPLPFHIVNILFHALAALLVLQLALRLGLSEAAAFWAALLFAVHPIHIESVTWISALKDPLFTASMIGSVLAFLRYRKDRRPFDYAVCLVLMVASLLTKSIAVATPLLLLVVDRWLDPPPRWRISLARAAGPAAIALLFMVQFILIGKANGVIGAPHGGSWSQHYFLMAWALVRYAQQVIAPATFRIHYCFVPLEGLFDPRLLGIAAFAVAVAVGLWLAARRQRVVGLLILWFFICLGPVANIVPFPAIMADRYLYAPSIAACLLVGWGLSQLTTLGKWILPATAMVFAVVTLLRGAFWHDPANLWAEAVEDDACLKDDLPTAAVMYLNHAAALKDRQLALVAYQKGIGHPRFGYLPRDHQAIYLRKGLMIAYLTGDIHLARKWSDWAVRVAPANSDVWVSRALTVGNPKAALDAAEHAVRLERSASAYWLRGEARLGFNQPLGINDIVAAVDLEPIPYCGYFLEWLSEKVAEPYLASLTSVRERCEKIVSTDDLKSPPAATGSFGFTK